MKLLFSIKEFSEMCGVLDSTLRYWDETGLLSPAWRNETTRYRYYSPEQIATVKFLELFTKLSIPLKDLAETHTEPVPERSLMLFQDCDRRLAAEIEGLQATRKMLQNHASLLKESQSVQLGNIEARMLPERPFRLIPLAKAGGRAGHDHLCQCLAQARGDNSPLGYAFQSFSALLKQPGRPTQLVSFDPKGPDTRPAGEYLVGTVACGYGETGGLPRRMSEYAWQNSLELHGPAYAVYLPDAASIAGAREYLLHISVAAKPRSGQA